MPTKTLVASAYAARVVQRAAEYGVLLDGAMRIDMPAIKARATGPPLLAATRPMTRVGRAVEKAETQGFMKVVVDAGSRKILGAAILGAGGDETIHGVIDIMNANVPCDVLQRAVPIHPTVSELSPTLPGDIKPVPSA